MAFPETLFFISTIYICCLTNYISASDPETIMGGEWSYNFVTYQVSIQGKENYSNFQYHWGAGAIIANQYVMSVASIFLERNSELKNMTFSVVAGSPNLRSPSAFRRYIQMIFCPYFDPTFVINNIAVLKLEVGLGLGQNLHLTTVELPYFCCNFGRERATVSGFGYFEVEKAIDQFSGNEVVISGNLSTILTVAGVVILYDDDCATWYDSIICITNMCGVTAQPNTEEISGVCMGDLGDPLVKGNVLLGLVSGITPDCDNTFKGALYMKVAMFLDEISGFLAGFSTSSSLIRYNRHHIPPSIV